MTAVDSDYQTDETYTYDANGNRTMTGYTTGDNNQVTSDGTYNYQYDDEGNRTRKTNISTGAYVDYTWDHRNRLTAVTYRTSGGTKTKEVTYTYDLFDRRIAKDVDTDGNGTIDWGERYAYDREDIIFVFDETDALQERLLHGPGIDQALATEDGSGNVLWLLADNQGTIRDVASYNAGTDTTTVVNHIQYDAFGNITVQSNSSYEPRFTYTGREWDADAELFYYRARWYDPQVGRFISEDPIGFLAGDTNISRYVGNGTPNFTDPSGLWEDPMNGMPTINPIVNDHESPYTSDVGAITNPRYSPQDHFSGRLWSVDGHDYELSDQQLSDWRDITSRTPWNAFWSYASIVRKLVATWMGEFAIPWGWTRTLRRISVGMS